LGWPLGPRPHHPRKAALSHLRPIVGPPRAQTPTHTSNNLSPACRRSSGVRRQLWPTSLPRKRQRTRPGHAPSHRVVVQHIVLAGARTALRRKYQSSAPGWGQHSREVTGSRAAKVPCMCSHNSLGYSIAPTVFVNAMHTTSPGLTPAAARRCARSVVAAMSAWRDRRGPPAATINA
jgi:hypothetical protein